jgi:NAD(P)-dependent dehydrogenase (short-subunit alcohol dehydrogenase family)
MKKEKIALVTGAGRGIGKSIALLLAENGYHVGVNYCSSEEEAKKVCKKIDKKGVKSLCVQADVGKLDEIDKMFEKFLGEFGQIDLMVNNSGISKFVPFLDVEEKTWDRITSVNWKGTYFCAQRAARNMVENNIKGHIINISSNHNFGCWPNATVYASNKAALTKFTKNAAMELAEYNIRVNAIAPGYTNVGWDRGNPIFEAESKIPLKRFASPIEIAHVVLYLDSEYASYITGECLKIDGGALLPVVAENNL